MCAGNENYLIEVGFGFEFENEEHKRERGFSRGHYIPYRAISSFIEERNKYSVFCSAYRYTDTDITKSTLYGDLYLDFDDLNDFESYSSVASQYLEEIQNNCKYSGGDQYVCRKRKLFN